MRKATPVRARDPRTAGRAHRRDAGEGPGTAGGRPRPRRGEVRPRAAATHSAEYLTQWFGSFASPVSYTYHDEATTTSGELAVVTALAKVSAVSQGASEPFTPWCRSTLVLRHGDDGWRIVHEHNSTPFSMDGTMRAAVDLQP
nr:nuclear transport factor 2 family protein [Amycolatopsis sulphurea]